MTKFSVGDRVWDLVEACRCTVVSVEVGTYYKDDEQTYGIKHGDASEVVYESDLRLLTALEQIAEAAE